MKEFGCAVLVGHGVSEEQFESINAECREFFGKSYEEKQTYNNGIYGNPLGGYTAPGNEIVALSNGDSVDMYGAQGTSERKTKFDPVENFVFTAHPLKYTSSLGQSAPFRSVCDYYEAMDALLKTIHKLSCGALGVADLDYFNKFYDPTLPGNENLGINGNALRLAHYPPINPVALHGTVVSHIPCPTVVVNLHPSHSCTKLPASTDSAGAFDDQVRYGAHTDYQGFTILRPDRSDWHCLDVQVQEPTSTSASSGSSRVLRVQCGGLEVFHRASGQWLQVCIPPHLNALVVNAGTPTHPSTFLSNCSCSCSWM